MRRRLELGLWGGQGRGKSQGAGRKAEGVVSQKEGQGGAWGSGLGTGRQWGGPEVGMWGRSKETETKEAEATVWFCWEAGVGQRAGMGWKGLFSDPGNPLALTGACSTPTSSSAWASAWRHCPFC